MRYISSFIFIFLFIAFAVHAQTPCECNDGIDNDGDGLSDWLYDLGCTDSTDCTEGGLPTRSIEDGWSVIEPAADTKIYYVSSSDGDDANDGLSTAKALKTFAAAYAKTRDGFPDWILLKRGDVFYETVSLRMGRSRAEPYVVSSYGKSIQRPLFKTGFVQAIKDSANGSFKNIALIGLDFYAHRRNPNDPDFTGYTGTSGFALYRSNNQGNVGEGVLIENCAFRYYNGSWVQGANPPRDVTIRRNLFEFSYSADSHSSGFFSNGVDSLLFEENILDHNGWLIQAIPPFHNDQSQGQATFFNHNSYIANSTNLIYRNNILLRSSSIGSKFTGDDMQGRAHDFIIDNNLYVDGEVGISIGGNDGVTPYRFKNIKFTNNVMLDLGRSQPTTRDIAWYIELDDWDGGLVENNLLLNQRRLDAGNTIAMQIKGFSRDVEIKNNVIFGLHGWVNLIDLGENSTKQNIAFTGNHIQCNYPRVMLIYSNENSISNYYFHDNSWFAQSNPSTWFTIANVSHSFASWQSLSGETGTDKQVTFVDSSRTLENYNNTIGQAADIDSFIVQVKQQEKYHWRTEYEAPVINKWFRDGFTVAGASSVNNVADAQRTRLFTVFPNPAREQFVISNLSSAKPICVKIFDILGKEIQSTRLTGVAPIS